MTGLDDAYLFCAEVTRTQARNFWYGIRLLPPVKRRALSAVYAFARRVDDIADGTDPADTKLSQLARTRLELRSLSMSDRDPVLLALADASRRLPIPLSAFEELIDGCAADIHGTRYETFDEMVGYCRQVAGSIGRLSLGVFGADDLTEASPAADALGIALQQTNILRDLREDRRNGRIYLPSEDLARFSVSLELGPDGELTEDLGALVAFQARRASQWYERGLRLLPMLDRRSAVCCGAMAGIYLRLLRRITADPRTVARSRMAVPVRQKAGVAARCLIGVGL